MRVVEWRGKPVWVLHRSPAMIASLKQDETRLADPLSKRTAYATPAYVLKDPSLRSIKPDYFVAVGICTHLGCSPSGRSRRGRIRSWATNGIRVSVSRFDLRRGRARLQEQAGFGQFGGSPYRFVSDAQMVIGDDKKST